jgi:peroxiredoxin
VTAFFHQEGKGMDKKVFIAIGLLIALAVGINSFLPEGIKPVAVGEHTRTFQLPDLQGKLQGLPKGKVMLLNFWATWCPPCRKEVPSMVDLYEKLKDKGFAIVAVSVDRSRSDVVNFVKTYNMNFTVLHDMDSSVSRQYGVFRYPETFIVDKKGVIRQHLNGAVDWSDKAYISYLEKLLAEPATK